MLLFSHLGESVCDLGETVQNFLRTLILCSSSVVNAESQLS